MAGPCEHLEEAAHRAHAVRPSGHGCEECLELGSDWVHLRLCLSCGHVGCCDNSPNRHATKHFHKLKHPVIRSFEPGEDWAYCYPDDAFADEFPSLPGEGATAHYSAP
jgi:uncharacterized UBP type Zn finger protein